MRISGNRQGKTKAPNDAGSLGSRFVIDAGGLIVTVDNELGNADDIALIFSDGRMLRATIVGSDREIDIAALRVNSQRPLKTIKSATATP